MPGVCRGADRARDPGHDLEAHARSGQRLGFLAAAPEHERVAALEPHHGRARAAALHEQRVDLVLGELDLARRLAGRDELRTGRSKVQEGRRGEPVVDDDVGAREDLGAAHRDETRVSGPCADEVDGHEASSSRPPCSRISLLTARPASIGSEASACAAYHHAPVERGEQRVDRHVVGVDGCECRARKRASAAQLGEKRALGSHCRVRVGVVDRGEPFERVAVVGAALHRERTLPHHREHEGRVESLGDVSAESETVEARGGEHDGVVLRRFLQSGVHVAAQLREREIRTGGCELRPASNRTGGDARADRQVVERRADEHVTRIAALGNGREHEPLGRDRRKVFRGVLRQVGLSVEHRELHLLDEHAGAAELVDRDVGPLISAGLHDHELDVAAEQLGHALGLPARQRAPSRREAHQVSWSARGSGRSNSSASSVGVELSASGAGGVLDPNRGFVQQLVDDTLGDRLDQLACCRVEGTEPRPVPVELAGTQLFGARAKRNDQRRDLPRRPVQAVAVELRGDEVAHLADLLPALREGVLAHRAQVVDVEQVDTEHFPCTGIDVAGNADVDDEQRSTAPAFHHLLDLAALHEQVGRAGGHEQHVAIDQRAGNFVERDGAPADTASELLAAWNGAVGDHDLEHTCAGERQRHAFAHLTRAEHEDASIVEGAEPTGCQ